MKSKKIKLLLASGVALSSLVFVDANQVNAEDAAGGSDVTEHLLEDDNGKIIEGAGNTDPIPGHEAEIEDPDADPKPEPPKPEPPKPEPPKPEPLKPDEQPKKPEPPKPVASVLAQVRFTVVDQLGRPVANTQVEVALDQDYKNFATYTTDASGIL
ncbi:hypothetical protein JDW15_09805, partial [Aerococcaceae bacterium zg-ZJ1578]|uniref:hypothetical protein n=1 Tax=Aerococcaceae bacterium zg-252 TaxID=2796928 RepID=UPI001A319520|nr:hypothetical protein [Aerococcaceae bacterium zg-1578]